MLRKINNISIIELETKQEVANLSGVKPKKPTSLDIFQLFISDSKPITNHLGLGCNWTHMKEISITGILVSVHHSYEISTNLEVFDVSRKELTKKIYSLRKSLVVSSLPNSICRA